MPIKDTIAKMDAQYQDCIQNLRTHNRDQSEFKAAEATLGVLQTENMVSAVNRLTAAMNANSASMDANSASTDKANRRMLWITVVIAIGAVVQAGAAIALYLKASGSPTITSPPQISSPHTQKIPSQ